MVSFKTRVKFMRFFIKTSVIFQAPLNAKLPTPSYLYQIFFKHIIFVSCRHYQPENPSIQRLYGSYISLTSVAFQLSFTTSKADCMVYSKYPPRSKYAVFTKNTSCPVRDRLAHCRIVVQLKLAPGF